MKFLSYLPVVGLFFIDFVYIKNKEAYGFYQMTMCFLAMALLGFF